MYPSVTVVVDTDEVIRYVSPCGHRWYGDAVGRPVSSVLGPAWLGRDGPEPVVDALSRRGRLELRTRHQTTDGEMEVVLTARPWREPDRAGINLEVAPSEEVGAWQRTLARLPEAERAERQRWFTAMDRLLRLEAIATHLAEASTLGTVADIVCGEATDGIGAAGARLHRLVRPYKRLELLRACGNGGALAPPVPRAGGLSVAEAVVRSGEELWADRSGAPDGDAGVEVAAVPMRSGGVLAGVLEFTFAEPRHVDEGDRDFARSVARQAAETMVRLDREGAGPPSGERSSVAIESTDPVRLGPRARRALAGLLAGRASPGTLTDAQLVVSELIANAALHAFGPACFVATVRDDELVIAVDDLSVTRPSPKAPEASEPTGRGLRIVDTIAREWGTEDRPWGKRVWAAMPLPVTGDA